ncbi:MAG: adaptor protein MecA [Lachnospiraceae bacterium]|nr:adaptor protein MecA [Agathobacter sp.]MDD6290836.1 adaptor protein MecA [Lachnospiraceae bacterium]
MKFSRIGKHTIRCVISEQEIIDLGYTLEEIMSNGERTQEFMNEIFDLAEQRFETKFELGIKTVRADFMSDHTLSLTFSEHPGSDEMMEHLKDIVNGLMNSIPQQKWAEISEAKKAGEDTEEIVRVIVTVVFPELDVLIRFAKQVTLGQVPPSALYKYKDDYMLIFDLSDVSEGDVKVLSALTDEYASDIQVGAERRAFIEEHGKVLLRERAVESLREL